MRNNNKKKKSVLDNPDGLLKFPEDVEALVEELREQYQSTEGHRKLVQYVKEIIKSDYFTKKIKYLRKKYAIPPEGFKPDDDGLIFPPKLWRSEKNWDSKKDLNKDIQKICERYSIHYMDWSDPIEEVLFYGSFSIPGHTNSYNLCLLSDIVEEKNESFGKAFEESDDMAFPIAIRISPYASKRDILDFVEKLYKHGINMYQQKYKNKDVKIGRIRKKKVHIQERNNFIYEHRHLPNKKIMRLLYDKYGKGFDIDYAYIGKIIANERQKRKEM